MEQQTQITYYGRDIEVWWEYTPKEAGLSESYHLLEITFKDEPVWDDYDCHQRADILNMAIEENKLVNQD